MIAVVLMVTGIGVIGFFTATVASFFFENQQAQDPCSPKSWLDWIRLNGNWTRWRLIARVFAP